MRVVCNDGWSLNVDRLPADGRPRGVMVVVHAMMVDRRSMDRPSGRGLASTLAAEGYEVLNADLRGHGLSGPSASEGGQWTYDNLVYQDLPALVAAAHGLQLGPVWVVGLSLGAHVAAASVGVGAIHVDGLILLSANIWTPALEPSHRRRAAKALALRSFLGVTAAAGRWPSVALGVGPADEALEYVRDLTGFWAKGWSSREGVDYWRSLSTIRCPTLCVVGRGDRLLAHRAGARRWAAGIPGAAFAVVGHGDLGLRTNPGHMGLATSGDCRWLWRWLAVWAGCQNAQRTGTSAAATTHSDSQVYA